MKALVNPFEIFSEKKLLLFGSIFMLITAGIASISSMLIFGSLKVVNNYHQTYLQALVNISITLISNTFILYLYGRIRYSRTRLVDVLAVILISHIVIYLLLYLTALPVLQNTITAVELEILDKGFQVPELSNRQLLILGAFGVFALSMLIYFFYLLVVGMKIAINSKSNKDAVGVIALVFIWNTILQFINPFI